MKKTRLSFRKSRWQRSDANEIKPDYNNAFTVLGVLLTELANAAAAVLLTVCAVSVVNTTVSHVRCPYYVYVWLFIFSVISGFINRLTSLDTRKWVRHAINTGLLLVFLLGVFIGNWQAAEHIKDGFLYVKGRYLEIINVYYGTSFVCPKGDKAFAGAFVGFVSFIVMLLLVTLAVQIKRRRMLTLFPTLMLAVQLCIGKSPSVSEVVMLTLCTLWCLIADGNARTVAGYDVNGSAQGNEALRTGQLTSNMMYTGYIRENDANRIAAAQLVQQFLTSKNFKYSKNPPSTDGKDVVENFLSNSRQGFCVHFASAGTMILRQMGVPCRYVSGYCAKEDSFKSGENDEDICEVKDSQSHAWVEIYLDDFGWIPVEMTPGYFEYVTGENPVDYIGVNGKKTNTGAAYNDSEHMNDTAADEDKLDEDAANEDTKNTDAENDDTAKDDTSKAAANSTSGDGSEKAYGSQSGADKRTDAQNSKTRPHIPPVILKTSLCVIFLTALTAIIVYIKRRRNILWEARLAKRVKKGRYSRAAIMINNRIYKGLGHPSKNRTDELYLANLKEKYCGPDYCGIHWDEYMRIIQKAVYSSEGITGEECFMIVETWRHLEKKDIRHNSQKNMYKNSMINKK